MTLKLLLTGSKINCEIELDKLPLGKLEVHQPNLAFLLSATASEHCEAHEANEGNGGHRRRAHGVDHGHGEAPLAPSP